MLVIDCTDCYTKVEFKDNVIETGFDEIEKVLTNEKENIKLFMVEDYIFEFIEYLKDGECSSNCIQGDEVVHWVIGKYITPVPHLTYMSEEEIWFKITRESINKFTFFFEHELVISMHGFLFFEGEFKENLIHRYNIGEIRNLNNDLCTYLLKKYNEDKNTVNIWNAFKCIGVYNKKE